MRINHHLQKAQRMKNTIKKLDYEEDYETMIENFVLIASHLINASMHKLGTLRIDKDIKHNQLFGVLKREEKIGKDSKKVSYWIQSLEQLRPSHVYGRGKNGETARKAEKILSQIEEVCDKILEENEKKS